MAVNLMLQSASGALDGVFLMSFGSIAQKNVKDAIDRKAAPPALSKDLAVSFGAPQPGTLAAVSVRVFEFARPLLAHLLPPEVPAQQIVGGLEDAPVSAAVFMNGSKAGVRFTLPGTTAGSAFRAASRLRRSNIDLLDLLTPFGGKTKERLLRPGPLTP
jgi:hypothetical protein